MARSMNLDVLVRLRDRLSGPLRRLRGNLKSLVNAGRQIGIIGTAIAAISFLGPIREAAAFQQKLLDIAGTANLSGQAAFDFASKAQAQYEGLALQIGQTSDTIAEGAGQMVAAGGKAAKVVNDVIGTIGKSATAANAEFSDMAGVATSLINTLNVPETELEGALAGLVTAGKEGSFELKEMARYFPQLTGQMKKFGISGREASDQIATMLQIAAKGTSDPGQAANNLNNFLSKALAPITQKNFRKMGVNIEAVMKDAATKGINPIEAMLQKIGKLTGVSEKSIGHYMAVAKKRGLEGGEALQFVREQIEAIGGASKIGKLFGDQQVLDFLIPMLSNIEEYKRIKGEVASATGSVIDRDFNTQMEGLNRQLTILGEIGTQAVRKVGLAFGTWLPDINAALMRMLKFVNDLDASTGGWVTSAITAAGGGLLLVGALGALGVALPVVVAGFGALASLAAVALSPIGLLIAAIGGGAVYVAKNWDRYGPRVMRMWERIRFGAYRLGEKMNLIDPSLSGAENFDRLANRIGRGIDRTIERIVRAKRFLNDVGAALNINLTQANVSAEAPDWLKTFADNVNRTVARIRSVKRFLNDFGAASNLSLTQANVSADAPGWMKTYADNVDRTVERLRSVKRFLNDFGAALHVNLTQDKVSAAAPDWMRGLEASVDAGIASMRSSWTGFVAWLRQPIAIPSVDWSPLSAGLAGVKDTIIGWIDAILSKIGEISGAVSKAIASVKGLGPAIGAAVSGGGLSSGATNPGGLTPRQQLLRPTPPAANSNAPAPDKRSSLASPTKLAAAVPAQRADVSGRIEIAVSGPGKVTSAKSSNSRVAMAPDRGRANLGNAA